MKCPNLLPFFLLISVYLNSQIITDSTFKIKEQINNCNLYTYSAKSLLNDDVQAAADSVIQHGGGIVYLPAGVTIWTNPIQVIGDVSFIGQGKELTKIHLDTTSGFFMVFNKTNGHSTFIRVSGMGFYALERDSNNDSARTSGESLAAIFYINNVDNYRIDHCYFEGIFHRAIQIINTPKGLIDNNIFKRNWYADRSAGNGFDATGYGIISDPVNSLTQIKPTAPTNVVKGFQAGVTARNRNNSIEPGNTVIAKLDDRKNSAAAIFNLDSTNSSGTISRIYFYINSAGENATVNIGIFEPIAENSFSTRSFLTNIKVHEGMNVLKINNDFTNLSIHQKDYIGIYLNNCSLSAQGTKGNQSWILSGNQIPCENVNFDTASVAQISLYAELYDSEGFMEIFEKKWDYWYSSEESKAERNGVFFDTNWFPGDINAHYIENNTFYWFKGAVGPWAGSLQNFVVRYNHIIAEHEIKYYIMTFNAGTNYAVIHDNIFEQTGFQIDGNNKAIAMTSSGLIYNNLFKNLAKPGYIGYSERAIQNHYLTDDVRIKELYIFNNSYENCGNYTEDNSTTWASGVGGAKSINWHSENYSIFFRPPQQGDRIYEEGKGRFNFTELQYPHPLSQSTNYKTKTVYIEKNICTNTSLNFNGKIITDKGIYIDTLIALNGCDSVIILTVKEKPVHTTIIDTSICENITYNHKNKSGTYFDTLQNCFGCDSIIITNLEVRNCHSENPDTNQKPTEITNIQNINSQTEISFYPNPSKGILFIDLNSYEKDVFIEFYNISGQKLLKKEILKKDDVHQKLNLNKYSPGIYIIKIISENKIITEKLFLK